MKIFSKFIPFLDKKYAVNPEVEREYIRVWRNKASVFVELEIELLAKMEPLHDICLSKRELPAQRKIKLLQAISEEYSGGNCQENKYVKIK